MHFQTYLKEAARQGLTEEEFLKLRTTKIRPKDMEVDGWMPRASGRFPITSSGKKITFFTQNNILSLV